VFLDAAASNDFRMPAFDTRVYVAGLPVATTGAVEVGGIWSADGSEVRRP
jgi:hypothetical protein